jgi:hypothetical protein
MDVERPPQHRCETHSRRPSYVLGRAVLVHPEVPCKLFPLDSQGREANGAVSVATRVESAREHW